MTTFGNDIAKTLEGLVKQYGDLIFDEPKKLKALLTDLCPTYRKEIVVLTNAAFARLPAELKNEFTRTPFETLVSRLANRLHDETGCTTALGKWAIETLAFALRLRTSYPPVPHAVEQPSVSSQIQSLASLPQSFPSPPQLGHSLPPPLPANQGQQSSVYLQRAIDLLRNKKLSSAISILENGLAKFPADPDIANLLAETKERFDRILKAVKQEIPQYKREKRICKLLEVVQQLQETNVPVAGLDRLRANAEAQIKKIEPMLSKAQLALDQHRLDDSMKLCSQIDEIVVDDDRVRSLRYAVNRAISRPTRCLSIMFPVGLLLWFASFIAAAVTAGGAIESLGSAFTKWSSGNNEMVSNLFSTLSIGVGKDRFWLALAYLFHGLYSAFLFGLLGSLLIGRELIKTIPSMCLVASAITALLSLALFIDYLLDAGLEQPVVYFFWGALCGLLIGTVMATQLNFDNRLIVNATVGGCIGSTMLAMFNSFFGNSSLNLIMIVSALFSTCVVLFRLIDRKRHIAFIALGSLVSLLMGKGLETLEFKWVIPFVPAVLLPLFLLPYQREVLPSLSRRFPISSVIWLFGLGLISALVVIVLTSIYRDLTSPLLLACWSGAWFMIALGVFNRADKPTQTSKPSSTSLKTSFMQLEEKFWSLVQFERKSDSFSGSADSVKQPIYARAKLTNGRLVVGCIGLTILVIAWLAKQSPLFGTKSNSIGMRLVRIPAGEFLMGSSEQGNLHKVRISKPFYMGSFEVTQAEYNTVMAVNPSHNWKGVDTANYPVEQVSWNDANEFCKRLSKKERKTYRLPTEAEWEYACRAGTKTIFHYGNQLTGTQANFSDSEIYSTVAVGTYRPNSFGLYDMHGNVAEWCQDYFDHDYYRHSPEIDPIGPASGWYRVIRGGEFRSSTRFCASAARESANPDNGAYNLGFRVVCEIR
jgi:formylglycine-generating enzyme required for sulfatase activity